MEQGRMGNGSEKDMKCGSEGWGCSREGWEIWHKRIGNVAEKDGEYGRKG
jgi:hypothetical protein